MARIGQGNNAVFAMAVALPLLLSGCAELGAGLGPEPSYEGCATDENVVTFDEYLSTGRTKSEAATAPSFTAPGADAVLSPATPATFRFQPTPTIVGSATGDASCPQYQPQRADRIAVQHLSPVSGTVFDLHVAEGEKDLYRVLTTRQSAGVPPSTWRSWAGKQLRITLYRARLLNNDLVEGPYRSAVLTVAIAASP